MSQPLSKLDIFRTGTESQEVTPDIERGVLLLEEVLGGIGVVRGEVVHGETISERWRVGHGTSLGGLGSLRRTLGRVVLVVSSPAEPLATVVGG